MSRNKKATSSMKQDIKAAEAKKREELMKTEKISFINPDGDVDKITFEQWWMMACKKVKMRSHIREILKVDFQARGLSLKETEEKYNEALRVFGYNI